jgi:hypothetical protein
MNSNFEDLLRLFNANRDEYLTVGGYAVMLYTEPRCTKHLDVWIAATSETPRLAQSGDDCGRVRHLIPP